MKRWDLKLSVAYGCADLIILNVVLVLIFNYLKLSSYFLPRIPVFSIIWVAFASAYNLYNFYRHSNLWWRLLNYLKCHISFSGILLLLALTFEFRPELRALIISLAIAFPVLDILFVAILMYSIGYLRTKGKNTKKVLIVGSGNTSDELLNYLESNPDFGYKVIGHLSDRPIANHSHYPVTGSWLAIDEVLRNFKLNEIIITTGLNEHEKIQHVLKSADFFGIRVRIIPDYYQLLGSNYTFSSFGDLPAINVRAISLDRTYLSIFKRLFDILFSLVAILVLSPLMLMLAVCIAVDSKGPIFYCPVRIGKSGKEFKLFKFRSMQPGDCNTTASQSTRINDPRITRVGAFIRKYSLDEIPQFINVLAGDMSVVGPRPHRINLNQAMQQEVDQYMLRHYLKPGITGWAQVNGWRGPTETVEERLQRTSHDLWYVNNWSMALDIKIIYRTLFDPKTHSRAF